MAKNLHAILGQLLGYDPTTGKPTTAAGQDKDFVGTQETALLLASPDHTFICAGPPLLRLVPYYPVAPIGLLNGFMETNQRPSMAVTEFGANYRQTLSGVASHSLTLQRVTGLYASLIGALYAWLPKDVVFDLEPNATGGQAGQKVSFTSDLLHVPFGLYMCQTTEGLEFVSATYYENCLLSGRGRSVTAGEAVITENAQITFERDLPAQNLLTKPGTQAYTLPAAADPRPAALNGHEVELPTLPTPRLPQGGVQPNA